METTNPNVLSQRIKQWLKTFPRRHWVITSAFVIYVLWQLATNAANHPHYSAAA